jgi:site-specific recombinase XerD
MGPKLYLRDKREKKSLVLLVWHYPGYGGSKKLKYSTKISVPSSVWDVKKQRTKKTPDFPHSANVNAALAKYVQKAEEIYYNYIARDRLKDLTVEKFKEELNIVFGRHQDKSMRILDYFNDHYERMKKECLKRGTNTHGAYLTELKRLTKYYEKKPFGFDDINLQWLEDYKDFLYSLGLSSGTVKKTFSRLKTVLREAFEDKVHTNQDFETSRFRVNEVKRGHTFLTIEEIGALYRLKDLSKTHGKMRDIFILQCFTGLRASDWKKINIDNFFVQDGKDFFRLTTKKGSKDIVIPAHPIVLKILEKYNWKLPEYVEQYINREIKKLCVKAGIDSLVNIKSSKGGIVRAIQKPKHKLISLHTARRSFATNAFLAGIDPAKIQAIIGHTQLAQTLEYIKATNLQIALDVSSSDFFSGEGFLRAG